MAWMKRFKVRGVVIGKNIMFADDRDNVPMWLFRHELQHAYQQIREGLFLFTVKYFYYQIRYGYQLNPFEIEAREAQTMTLTDYEEKILWKLREG